MSYYKILSGGRAVGYEESSGHEVMRKKALIWLSTQSREDALALMRIEICHWAFIHPGDLLPDESLRLKRVDFGDAGKTYMMSSLADRLPRFDWDPNEICELDTLEKFTDYLESHT